MSKPPFIQGEGPQLKCSRCDGVGSIQCEACQGSGDISIEEAARRLPEIKVRQTRVALDYLTPIWGGLWATVTDALLDHEAPNADYSTPANLPVDFGLRLTVWNILLGLQAEVAYGIVGVVERLGASVSDDEIRTAVRRVVSDVLGKEKLVGESELERLLEENTIARWKLIPSQKR